MFVNVFAIYYIWQLVPRCQIAFHVRRVTFPAKRRRITRRKYCFWTTLIVSNTWNAGGPTGKWKCQLSRLERLSFCTFATGRVRTRCLRSVNTSRRPPVLNTPPTSGMHVSYVNSNNNNNNNRMKKTQARTLWLRTTMTVLLLLYRWCRVGGGRPNPSAERKCAAVVCWHPL